ncbi:MAG: DinB family protein [Chitinophagaceae bacterium]
MDLLTFLTNTQKETLPFFDLPKDDLSKTYAPGKWNIQQILVHLTDADSVMLDRIRRAIAEPSVVVWAFDQDIWCDRLEYQNFPLELSKASYIANRQITVFLAQKYYATLGANQFVHSQTGLRTLKDEFDKVAIHNQTHINQIKMALSK